MPVGVIHCHIIIPGCRSLKEKRSRLKPIMHRIRKQFNVSIAEMDSLDVWNESYISCAVVCNEHFQAEKIIRNVAHYIEKEYRDLQIVDYSIEIL